MGRESIKLFLILEKLKLRSYFNRGTVPCYLVISFIYSICLVEFNKKIAGWSYFSIVADSGAIYFGGSCISLVKLHNQSQIG